MIAHTERLAWPTVNSVSHRIEARVALEFSCHVFVGKVMIQMIVKMRIERVVVVQTSLELLLMTNGKEREMQQ